MRYLTKHIIIVSLLVAVSLVVAALHFRPRPVPLDECSELYRRYADNPDIRAAYVKNYRINDTLTLSATLLEAANDTGWAVLQHDFKIIPYPPEIMALIKDTNTVSSWYVQHGTSNGAMDTVHIGSNDFVVASQFKHFVTIFDLPTGDQVMAIFYKNSGQLNKNRE